MTDTEAPDADLLVRGEELNRGNDPLVEYAASQVGGINGADYPVTFTVAYERPNARKGEPRWSSLDRVTVTSEGVVTGAAAT